MLRRFGIHALRPEWARMIDRRTIVPDVYAGIGVGCAAVPLSLAIAMASNVPPEVGLGAAVVGGVAGSLLGGTTLAVTGPAAAMSVLVAESVHTHGLAALPLITAGCGALQLATGLTRQCSLISMTPVPVIGGFTTGVGLTIASGQLPIALGLEKPDASTALSKFQYVAEHLADTDPASVALAAGTMATMLVLPRLSPKAPAALVAVGATTWIGMGLDVPTVGAIPSTLGMTDWYLPPMDAVPSLAATSAMLYALCSLESLLSCSALDRMRPTAYPHDPSQELIGQGVANCASSVFAGMPVTSVIARSSINVALDGQTRLSALVQSGFVLGTVTCLAPFVALVPMATLSGVLGIAVVKLLDTSEVRRSVCMRPADAIPFMLTAGGIAAYGLPFGILAGYASAVCTSASWSRMSFRADEGNTFHLQGPLTFLSVPVVDALMHSIDNTKQPMPVVDAAGLTDVDYTASRALLDGLQSRDVVVRNAEILGAHFGSKSVPCREASSAL